MLELGDEEEEGEGTDGPASSPVVGEGFGSDDDDDEEDEEDLWWDDEEEEGGGKAAVGGDGGKEADVNAKGEGEAAVEVSYVCLGCWDESSIA